MRLNAERRSQASPAGDVTSAGWSRQPAGKQLARQAGRQAGRESVTLSTARRRRRHHHDDCHQLVLLLFLLLFARLDASAAGTRRVAANGATYRQTDREPELAGRRRCYVLVSDGGRVRYFLAGLWLACLLARPPARPFPSDSITANVVVIISIPLQHRQSAWEVCCRRYRYRRWCRRARPLHRHRRSCLLATAVASRCALRGGAMTSLVTSQEFQHGDGGDAAVKRTGQSTGLSAGLLSQGGCALAASWCLVVE